MQCIYESFEWVIPGDLTRSVVDNQSPLCTFDPHDGWSVDSTIDLFEDFGNGPLLVGWEPLADPEGHDTPSLQREGPEYAHTGFPECIPNHRMSGVRGLRLVTEMPDHPDYYTSAQTIATQLFERGEFDWSREIEEAIEGGFTATEILMRIRLALRRLLRSGVATEDEAVLAQTLVAQLDGVLR
jgi:hypothetical protein